MIKSRLKWCEVLKRINRGYPFLEPFHGTPMCFLSVSPFGREIIFKIKAGGILKSKQGLKKIQITAGKDGKEINLKCKEKELFPAFYEICNLIADCLQIQKLTPASAISESLAKLENILQKQKLPARERILGILGEIIFFNELLKYKKPEEVYEYWTGIKFEEHDFTCPTKDIEIKTTSKEVREHKITSITQLAPKTGRKLYLVSYMMTPGTGKKSFTLPELIKKISIKKGGKVIADQIQSKINFILDDSLSLGLCNKRYTLRQKPCGFHVDDNFPKITKDSLKNGAGLINDVTYNIVLEGIANNQSAKNYEQLFKSL